MKWIKWSGILLIESCFIVWICKIMNGMIFNPFHPILILEHDKDTATSAPSSAHTST
jgi:hypothetical protein